MIETQAPEGFVIFPERHKVIIEKSGNTYKYSVGGGEAEDIDNHYVAKIVITNDMGGSILPETGDVGTIILMSLGALIVAGAGIMLVMIFFVGSSLLLYPLISNMLNEVRSSKIINSYNDYSYDYDNEYYDRIYQEAVEYNKKLLYRSNPYKLTPELQSEYKHLLNPGNDGVIGYIDIDKIIDKDKDYCTLLTCTPYGINTHRLLVRGHRVRTIVSAEVVSKAVKLTPTLVAIVIAVPILMVLFLVVMLRTPGKK